MDSLFGIIFVIAFLAFLFGGTPDMYDALLYHLSGGDLEALAEWSRQNLD